MSWGYKDPNKIFPGWNAELDKIRKLAPKPPKTIVYRYLEAAYRFAIKLRKIDKQKLKDLKKYVAKENPRTTLTSFRMVIDKTVSSETRAAVRWRYTKVLQYARQKKVKAADLGDFIEREGGLKECERKCKKS